MKLLPTLRMGYDLAAFTITLMYSSCVGPRGQAGTCAFRQDKRSQINRIEKKDQCLSAMSRVSHERKHHSSVVRCPDDNSTRKLPWRHYLARDNEQYLRNYKTFERTTKQAVVVVACCFAGVNKSYIYVSGVLIPSHMRNMRPRGGRWCSG